MGAYRSAERVVSPDAGGLSLVRWGTGELVLGAEAWVTVDLATGAATSPTAGPGGMLGWSERVELSNGTTATWRAGLDSLGAEFQGGAVTDPDGSELFALPAPVWRTDIDDGSAPGVLLVVTPGAAGQLQGLDARTGEVAWTADVVVNQALARLGGTALVRDGLAVVALRIQDGRELWRVPIDQQGDIEPLTDGELVVVVVGADGNDRFLAAYRLEDGQEVWRRELAVGDVPHALAGRLLLVGPTGTTAIG